jgi:polyisoprenoid-binding protein YceI
MTQPRTDHGPPATPTGASRRTVGLLVGAGAVAFVALAGFLAWTMFFGGEAPPPATIDDAVGVVTGSPSPAASADPSVTGSPSASTDPSSPTGSADGSDPSDIAGTWTIDTSIGAADGSGASVGFRVAEELSGFGAATAVGSTPAVSGSLTIEGTTLTTATIEADLTQVTSDRSRRDGRIQEALDTGTYPTATFTLSEPVDLGEAAASGETIEVTATGELTIHGQAVPTAFALQAQLVDGVIVVVGSTDATFSDWGITMPTAPIVLSVSDEGTIELQLFFSKG